MYASSRRVVSSFRFLFSRFNNTCDVEAARQDGLPSPKPLRLRHGEVTDQALRLILLFLAFASTASVVAAAAECLLDDFRSPQQTQLAINRLRRIFFLLPAATPYYEWTGGLRSLFAG